MEDLYGPGLFQRPALLVLRGGWQGAPRWAVKVLERGRDHCRLRAHTITLGRHVSRYLEMSLLSAWFERILPALTARANSIG
jgi:hypothetical protein